jgi:hypothetical protein
MPLREKGSEVLLGGVSLEYEPTAGATKFMVRARPGAGCLHVEGVLLWAAACL